MSDHPGTENDLLKDGTLTRVFTLVANRQEVPERMVSAAVQKLLRTPWCDEKVSEETILALIDSLPAEKQMRISCIAYAQSKGNEVFQTKLTLRIMASLDAMSPENRIRQIGECWGGESLASLKGGFIEKIASTLDEMPPRERLEAALNLHKSGDISLHSMASEKIIAAVNDLPPEDRSSTVWDFWNKDSISKDHYLCLRLLSSAADTLRSIESFDAFLFSGFSFCWLSRNQYPQERHKILSAAFDRISEKFGERQLSGMHKLYSWLNFDGDSVWVDRVTDKIISLIQEMPEATRHAAALSVYSQELGPGSRDMALCQKALVIYNETSGPHPITTATDFVERMHALRSGGPA